MLPEWVFSTTKGYLSHPVSTKCYWALCGGYVKGGLCNCQLRKWGLCIATETIKFSLMCSILQISCGKCFLLGSACIIPLYYLLNLNIFLSVQIMPFLLSQKYGRCEQTGTVNDRLHADFDRDQLIWTDFHLFQSHSAVMSFH